MKNRQRISPRMIKNFLQLAAATFALSANLPAAAAEAASRNTPPQKGRSIERRGEVPPRAAALPAKYVFQLSGEDAEHPAKVDVISADKGLVVRAMLHVPGRLGPLAVGAYTVAIQTPSGDDLRSVKIGARTDRYLHFTVDAKNPAKTEAQTVAQTDLKSHSKAA